MPRIEIEVEQIVPTAISLTLEPGDRVLIKYGVIIAALKQRVQQPLDADVINLLRSDGPLTASQIAAYYNLPVKARDGLQVVLTRLRRSGQIKPTEARRLPPYQASRASAP